MPSIELIVQSLFQLWLLATCFGHTQESSAFHNSMQGLYTDYGHRQNVSCVAHDAKFTCDCHNVNQHMVLPRLMGYVFQVEISNCKALTIDAIALAETQGVRKFNMKNIGSLTLHRNALAFPRFASNTPLIMEFENVNFDIIESHAINGNIEEISFLGGRINLMQPFGFSTLKERGALLLKMENMYIRHVEPQAFKKFVVEHMDISNCVFEANLPSKAFYELEVLNTLRLHNLQFKNVHSRAFSFRLVSKLSITNNHFLAVDSEWLEAYVLDSALLRDNHFGMASQLAFSGITVHRDYIASERMELRFSNNTVSFPLQTPKPLEFSDRFRLSIDQLYYENSYSCRDVDTNVKPARPKTPFFRINADKIFFQRSSGSAGNQSFIALSKIIDWDCKQSSYIMYILLAALALVLVSIAVGICLWLRHAKKHKRRKMDVVLPEPRTYKETQIVYQIENAGLLKTDL